MKTEKVTKWMTENPITVTPKTTLPEAHGIMKTKRIRRLPVVNSKGVLVGIISLGDIRGAEASPATSLSIWELNYILAKLKVKQFMTKNPVTATADMTIGEAAQLMLYHKISGLPIVDVGNKPIGIITESDIFEMVVLNEWDVEGVPMAG